jgi:hypothetical protein
MEEMRLRTKCSGVSMALKELCHCCGRHRLTQPCPRCALKEQPTEAVKDGLQQIPHCTSDIRDVTTANDWLPVRSSLSPVRPPPPSSARPYASPVRSLRLLRPTPLDGRLRLSGSFTQRRDGPRRKCFCLTHSAAPPPAPPPNVK